MDSIGEPWQGLRNGLAPLAIQCPRQVRPGQESHGLRRAVDSPCSHSPLPCQQEPWMALSSPLPLSPAPGVRHLWPVIPHPPSLPRRLLMSGSRAPRKRMFLHLFPPWLPLQNAMDLITNVLTEAWRGPQLVTGFIVHQLKSQDFTRNGNCFICFS